MTLTERDQQVVWHPYTQAATAQSPVPVVRAEGALLFTEDGREIIDAVSSWWVTIHGHAHPYIADRVYGQLRKLEHVIFAGFTHPPAVELAERLLQHLPANQSRIFFSDNGSTAVEIAIKMAIQYFYNRGERRRYLIAFDQAFHGETFGAMSASGDLSLNRPFQDHLFEVLRIPAPLPGKEAESLAALEEILARHPVYAFIFEPLVMGAGGMLMYAPEALDRLLAACRRQGVLCIADEVMTGFGRTGRLFACDYLREKPDLMCLSKGLTGGTLPLAVTSCSKEVFAAFLSEDKGKTFFHGHSFTANPVGCAAALASLDLLEHADCRQKIAAIADCHSAFRRRMAGHPAVREMRQTGTILAVEFQSRDQTSYFNRLRDRLYHFFLERNVLLRPLGNVIYVLPPYCITEEQLLRVYGVIEEALHYFSEDPSPDKSKRSSVSSAGS